LTCMVNLNNGCVTDCFQFIKDYPIALNEHPKLFHIIKFTYLSLIV